MPKAINDICRIIGSNHGIQNMSNENISKTNSHSRSATRTLKEGINGLINKLNETVCASTIVRYKLISIFNMNFVL